MPPPGSLGRALCQAVVAIAAVPMMMAAAARAAEPPEATGTPAALPPTGTHDAGEDAPPFKYQGAYWGLQVHTGLVYRLDARSGDLPGPVIGASARIASILSIADFQATALGSVYDVGTRAGDEVGIGRLSLGVEGHLHPLFMQHLQNSTFWFWAAGLYGALGIDLDVTWIDGAGVERTELDLGWHLGAGTDIPITDPHQGWSLWLGLSYRLKFLSVETGIGGLGNFSEHTFIITLAYRNNDVFFTRVPRPSEFDYRDPALPE